MRGGFEFRFIFLLLNNIDDYIWRPTKRKPIIAGCIKYYNHKWIVIVLLLIYNNCKDISFIIFCIVVLFDSNNSNKCLHNDMIELQFLQICYAYVFNNIVIELFANGNIMM